MQLIPTDSNTVEPTTFLWSKGGTTLTRREIRGHNSHFIVVSINQCVLHVSVDISVGKGVLMSAILLMCTSVHSFCPLIYWSIDWLIGEYWCMGFEIDTARTSICVRWYASLRLRWWIGWEIRTAVWFPTDVSLCQFRPSVDKSINWSIDRSIGEYWCLGFEIDTSCPSICVYR